MFHPDFIRFVQETATMARKIEKANKGLRDLKDLKVIRRVEVQDIREELEQKARLIQNSAFYLTWEENVKAGLRDVHPKLSEHLDAFRIPPPADEVSSVPDESSGI